MAASSPQPLSKTSQESFIKYYKSCQNNCNDKREATRNRFVHIDKVYQREVDTEAEHERAKAANRAGNSSRYQNVTVPVVMPQVEAAVTYQTSVYLTGDPIFGVVAAPAFIDEALQMESVLEEQALVGGWTRQLILSFRDGFKYNFAPVEVTWETKKTAALETDIQFSSAEAKPTEVIWAGNKVKRLDPYNVFYDHRVHPTEVHSHGEFVGYTDYVSRIALKQYIEELPDKIIANVVPAFESSKASSGTATHDANMAYFIPTVNSDVNSNKEAVGGTNWLAWAALEEDKRHIDYKDSYERTVLYCRVLPSELGLKIPSRNTPQIFKLVIINHEHVIYCERQTNAHNMLPILIAQPHEDGLDMQTKSLATNGEDFQHVTSAYMNSILASRRRAITDRLLYDPSRITQAAINSDNPSAKIPVRPAAYGKNVQDSVYQFPYREDQSQHAMQQINMLLGLSNSLVGQNQAQQGQFVKGNKTLHEFESVMQNANGRDQLASILLEAQIFTPMKHILKTNILQFQGGTTIYNRSAEQMVEVDPVKLRKAVLDFRISDGLTPSSKIMNGETFAVAIQQIGSSPQLAGGYNLAPMFSYLMKSQGADIAAFEKSEEQMAYEQAVGQWQQVMTAIAEGKTEIPEGQLPPQPTPEQFGYNPKPQAPVEPEG